MILQKEPGIGSCRLWFPILTVEGINIVSISRNTDSSVLLSDQGLPERLWITHTTRKARSHTDDSNWFGTRLQELDTGMCAIKGVMTVA